MTYPTIDAHRFLYNLDGTQVGFNTTTNYANGVTGYLTQTEMDNLQSESGNYTNTHADVARCFWWFFPEQREVTMFNSRYVSVFGDTANHLYEIQGSNDTTNGVDGTWENLTFTKTSVFKRSAASDWWRIPGALTPVTAGASYKVLRCRLLVDCSNTNEGLKNIHLYGRKAHGANPDDIIFIKADGTTPYTALHDFGSTQEGLVYNADIYVKNESTTLTANNITVAIGGMNAANHTISMNSSAFGSSVLISSLAPGAQQLITVQNAVGQPPQNLQPRNAYIRATVESWT